MEQDIDLNAVSMSVEIDVFRAELKVQSTSHTTNPFGGGGGSGFGGFGSKPAVQYEPICDEKMSDFGFVDSVSMLDDDESLLYSEEIDDELVKSNETVMKDVEEAVAENGPKKEDIFDHYDGKSKKKAVKNEYEWIESSLKGQFGIFKDSLIGRFRQHKVTDDRLRDLNDLDWQTLISAVGIRNEMKKLYRMKMNEKIGNKMDDTDKEKVREWLQKIGFEIYLECFIINGFDSLEVVKGIDTKEELQSIGIQTVSHQIKLLKQIKKL